MSAVDDMLALDIPAEEIEASVAIAEAEIIAPTGTAHPAPVERVLVTQAIARLAPALSELARYLVDGPAGEHFAFQQEVAALLTEGLRLVLDIEAARLASTPPSDRASIADERETLGQMQATITRFQEVWGRD